MYLMIRWKVTYQVTIIVGSEEALNNAMNSFAINSNGSIKVAYIKGEIEQMETTYEEVANETEEDWDTSATSTKNSDGSRRYVVTNGNNTMYSSNISYRNIIQDYYLPFEFLWAIVVIGDDGSSSAGNSEDLAHAIASMAYDGEIRLIVDDNSSQVITEEVTGFDLVNYISYTDICLFENGQNRGNTDEINEPQDSEHFVSIYTKTETNSSPTLRVRKIEGWSAIYDKTPSYANNVMQGATEQDKTIDNTSEWTNTAEKEFFEYKYSECPEEKVIKSIDEKFRINKDEVEKYNLQYNRRIRSRKENITKTSTQNSVTKSYGNASSVTPDFNQDIADLINVSSFSAIKRYITRTSYGSFMEVIEGNTTTANMVDLVNYIFNQVTDSEDYGKDLEWDSIWKSSSNYTDSDSGKVIAADTIQAKVWFSLKNEGYSDVAVAGLMGNIEGESGFNPAITEEGNGIGFGLCQWSFERRTALEGFAKSRGVSASDEDIQIEFLIAELTSGGGADGYATYQFSGYEDQRSIWMTTNDIEEATTAFCAGFERPGIPRIPERIVAAKKYYDEFQGATLGSNAEGGTLERSNTKGIKGYYTSSVSGRRFTLYWQDVIGSPWYWESGCFHCSIATIVSGFGQSPTPTPNQLSGWMSEEGGNRSDFTTYGGAKYDTSTSVNANDIKKYLQNGEAILFHITGGSVRTDNGSETHPGHWLALLDYKNENGVDKVYVHDPWSTHSDYGWGEINGVTRDIVEYVHVWK